MTIKKPWEEPDSPWKTESSYYSWMRGGLRRVWNKMPTKLNLIKKHRKQIVNPNPKGKKPTVWGGDCAMCGGEFVEKLLQVDHIVPAGSLRTHKDIQGFIERLLIVTEDDLRLVCVDCNNALSISEKQGITYEEALVVKEAIAICKESVQAQKDYICKYGLIPASNAKGRREQIENILRENKEK